MSNVTHCDNCHEVIRNCCVFYRIKRYSNNNDMFCDSEDFDICASCLEKLSGEDLMCIMRWLKEVKYVRFRFRNWTLLWKSRRES